MPTEQSLGCARCGDCCQAIWISDSVAISVDLGVRGPNHDFIREHWTEIERSSSGVRMSCDQYDTELHLCGAHDQRPPVCSDFPWYGREPGQLDGLKISGRCSYWLEVSPAQRPADARPLIPLAVLS